MIYLEDISEQAPEIIIQTELSQKKKIDQTGYIDFLVYMNQKDINVIKKKFFLKLNKSIAFGQSINYFNSKDYSFYLYPANEPEGKFQLVLFRTREKLI